MYRASDRFDLVAVCDPDAAARDRFADKWRVSARFASVEEMLAQSPVDVVSIACPTPHHADTLNAVADAGTRVLVNYQRRLSGNFVDLRRFVADGGLGRMQQVTLTYPLGVVHNGTHAIDLLRWYFGAPSWVQAIEFEDEPGGDAIVDFLLGFDAGPSSLIAHVRGARRQPVNLFEVDLLGSRGRVRMTLGGRRLDFLAAGSDPDYPHLQALLPAPAPIDNDWNTVYRRAAEHLAALADQPDTRPACSLHDGLEALRIAETVRAAARDGNTQERIPL